MINNIARSRRRIRNRSSRICLRIGGSRNRRCMFSISRIRILVVVVVLVVFVVVVLLV